jgi:hypothetical protein
MKKIQPYGLWPSLITSDNICLRLGLQDVQWNSDGLTLVWLESRSGINTLYQKTGNEARQTLTEGQNIRGTSVMAVGIFVSTRTRCCLASEMVAYIAGSSVMTLPSRSPHRLAIVLHPNYRLMVAGLSMFTAMALLIP